MTILGVGIDLVSVERIRLLVERWEDRFLNRVYTEAEQRDCLSRITPYASLAGRFAAKEAVLKALGVGWAKGVRWIDVQVTADEQGKPVARVQGQVQALLEAAGVRTIHVSLSHDAGYAVAQAILTNEAVPQQTR